MIRTEGRGRGRDPRPLEAVFVDFPENFLF